MYDWSQGVHDTHVPLSIHTYVPLVHCWLCVIVDSKFDVRSVVYWNCLVAVKCGQTD